MNTLFDMSCGSSRQRSDDYVFPPDKPATLAGVLEACKGATCLSIFQDGELSIFVDDVPDDLRQVIRVRADRRRVDVSILREYDSDAHCWREEGRSYSVDIENKRGEKKLRGWCDALNTLHHYYPRPKIASYYRRNGELSK